MSDEHDQRPTDAPYGPEECQQILAAARTGGRTVCPRCGGVLETPPPANPTKSMFQVYLLRCPSCRRAVFHGEYLRRPTT